MTLSLPSLPALLTEFNSLYNNMHQDKRDIQSMMWNGIGDDGNGPGMSFSIFDSICDVGRQPSLPSLPTAIRHPGTTYGPAVVLQPNRPPPTAAQAEVKSLASSPPLFAGFSMEPGSDTDSSSLSVGSSITDRTSKSPKKDKEQKDPPKKRTRRKKAVGSPKRPLSAYNIFFRQQRALILASTNSSDSVAPGSPGLGPSKEMENQADDISLPAPRIGKNGKRMHRKIHGMIGFKELATQIAAKWKDLDAETRSQYEAQAAKERERYRKELEIYNAAMARRGVVSNDNASLSPVQKPPSWIPFHNS